MPLYTYKCESCGWLKQKREKFIVKSVVCLDCGDTATRQVPKLSGHSESQEIVNKTTGVTVSNNQKRDLRVRSDKYYWEVEVPRLVNSNVYTVETMLENGWITLLEDGSIEINNKPPQTR